MIYYKNPIIIDYTIITKYYVLFTSLIIKAQDHYMARRPIYTVTIGAVRPGMQISVANQKEMHGYCG